MPGRESLIGSSHLVNASSLVLLAWMNVEKAEARQRGDEVDDDKPCFVISCAKNRFSPVLGKFGLYQHKEARLLCNNRQRMYKPIDITMEEPCQSEKPTGESRTAQPVFCRRGDRRVPRDRSRDDDELRGIPFLEEIDERELLVVLNNLSAMEQ